MIKLKDLLQENSNSTYEYGCVMLYFDFPKMSKIHSVIKPEDIYTEEGDKTYGLEDEPHCTLLYGLHNGVTPEAIKRIVNHYDFNKCILSNSSLFENEKYDVLKFDVQGDSLHKCNSALTALPHTNSYPDYHPHCTIGYLKSGSGKRYAGALNKLRFTLKPSHIIYSLPSGEKIKIEI